MERNSTTGGKPPQTLNADPRINSPEIKVVYPAQQIVQKDLILPSEQTTQNGTTTQIQETASVASSVIEQQTSTPVVISQKTVELTNPATNSFLDCIKQNLSTFLIVCTVMFALGYLINKNK